MPIAIAHAVAELSRMYPPAASEPPGKALTGLLIGTLLLAALFYLLERFFPERPAQRALRPGTRVDAIYWFFDFFVAKRLATAASIVVLIAAVVLRMPRLALLAHQPLWLQAVEAVLAAEFCGYWSHRMMHQIPALWRLHKIHHSSERLDWLAAARVHPLESAWNRVIALLPLFLLGFSLLPAMRWSFGAGATCLQPGLLHRWHHSADREALNKNYSGLLPLFDFLFGTAHFPQRKPISFGLADDRAPAGFWHQLLWPFRSTRYPMVR